MLLNNLIVFGLSHEELNLEEREKLLKTNILKNVEELFQKKIIKSYINVSTCLRQEFYCEVKDNFSDEEVHELFPIYKEKIYIKRGIDAVDYLFKVICGYYSMIKGEDQILGQIKTSYFSSLDNNKSSKLLNISFNKAIELGKKFRTVSNIAQNALSLEAISINFLKSLSDTKLKEDKIFVLGIGDLSKSILELLIKDNINNKNISITNRSYHKAEKIQNDYSVHLIDYHLKYQGLIDSDIIISATSAPHIVVEYERFKNMMKDKKYIFLDLAVPRDIDTKLEELDNVSIYNIDNIWEIYNKNYENRNKLITDYYYLLDEQKEKFLKSLEYYERYAYEE